MNSILINGLGAGFTSMFICGIFMPWVIQGLKNLKLGQMIQDDGPAHQEKAHTPTMAGLWLVLVWQVSCIFWMKLNNPVFWILELVLLGYFALGMVDDISKIVHKDNNLGLTVKMKALGQWVIAVLGVWLWMTYTPYDAMSVIKFPNIFSDQLISLDLGVLYPLFAVLVIVGSANSVNLTDGLDGLVSIPIVCACLGLISVIVCSDTVMSSGVLNNPQLAEFMPQFIVYLSALIGVFLAFLWFNCHPAEVFLGDTGSMCVGAILGFIALMLKVEIYYAIISGLFIAEALSVIIQVGYYKLYKKRVFLMAPIHHHYEKKGWSEAKVVTRFWLISVICLLLGCMVILLS